jgi:hypothetical protein
MLPVTGPDAYVSAMNETPGAGRTFDRDEVASILRDAAQLDQPDVVEVAPSTALTDAAEDGLTLAEIARAAEAVGIGRSAVTAAWMRQALRAAHVASAGSQGRAHVTHELTGELSRETYERLAGEVRTLVAPSAIRRTADGLELDIGAPSGAPGSLTIQIRSSGGATTLSLWSIAPAMSGGDIASLGLLGAPVFVFPVVAASGGQWPAVGAIAALGAAGAAAGVGLGAVARRWRITRWHERVERAVVPIALRVSELIAAGDASTSTPRAQP